MIASAFLMLTVIHASRYVKREIDDSRKES